MRIVKTTDGQHIGVNIDIENVVNEVLTIGDFSFVLQSTVRLDNNNVLLSNPNYQIELEEQ